MRVSILSPHPHQFTQQRLLQELQSAGHDAELLRPQQISWSWPDQAPAFDLTFNRLSAVDSGAFESALSALPRWGRQVNPWRLRQELWDKAHQALWLGKLGLQAPATFMIQGAPDREFPVWREFVGQHDTGLGWVLKFNRGQRGVGVNFLADEEALFSWLETLYRLHDQDFIIQPRLPQEDEYRLTFLGGKPWALLKREGVKANFAQGGKAEEIQLQDWPQFIRPMAEALRSIGEDTYLSLDLLLVPEGVRVLDVNPVPGIEQLESVTGRNFTAELVQQSVELVSR